MLAHPSSTFVLTYYVIHSLLQAVFDIRVTNDWVRWYSSGQPDTLTLTNVRSGSKYTFRFLNSEGDNIEANLFVFSMGDVGKESRNALPHLSPPLSTDVDPTRVTVDDQTMHQEVESSANPNVSDPTLTHATNVTVDAAEMGDDALTSSSFMEQEEEEGYVVCDVSQLSRDELIKIVEFTQVSSRIHLSSCVPWGTAACSGFLLPAIISSYLWNPRVRISK